MIERPQPDHHFGTYINVGLPLIAQVLTTMILVTSFARFGESVEIRILALFSMFLFISLICLLYFVLVRIHSDDGHLSITFVSILRVVRFDRTNAFYSTRSYVGLKFYSISDGIQSATIVDLPFIHSNRNFCSLDTLESVPAENFLVRRIRSQLTNGVQITNVLRFPFFLTTAFAAWSIGYSIVNQSGVFQIIMLCWFAIASFVCWINTSKVYALRENQVVVSLFCLEKRIAIDDITEIKATSFATRFRSPYSSFKCMDDIEPVGYALVGLVTDINKHVQVDI